MTDRIYVHLVLIAATFVYTSLAAADVFMCDRAAQFGFADSLCEKPTKGPGNLGEQSKVNAPAPWMAPDDHGDDPTKTFGHAKSHWQAEWSNWRSWEHGHGWNSLSHVHPFTGRFDQDWIQLRIPHVHRRAVAPARQPERRPRTPPH